MKRNFNTQPFYFPSAYVPDFQKIVSRFSPHIRDYVVALVVPLSRVAKAIFVAFVMCLVHASSSFLKKLDCGCVCLKETAEQSCELAVSMADHGFMVSGHEGQAFRID